MLKKQQQNIVFMFQVHVGPMRSTSTGCMKLKSPNPMDHPIIQPNYLSTGKTQTSLFDRNTAEDKTQNFSHLFRYWCVGIQAVCQTVQRNFRPEGLRPVSRPRSPTWPPGPVRCRDRRFRPPEGRQRLPPLLHLQNGFRLRSDGGGRLERTGLGSGAAEGGRRLHHAQHREREPQRPYDHDSGEGSWYHQRSASSRGPGGSRVPTSDTWNPEMIGRKQTTWFNY